MLAAGGLDRRNEEAVSILLKQALRISPDLPREQTLKTVLDLFKGLNESGILDAEERKDEKRVKPIVEMLSSRISKDSIIECCKDKFLIEALEELISQRIDPKYIIE